MSLSNEIKNAITNYNNRDQDLYFKLLQIDNTYSEIEQLSHSSNADLDTLNEIKTKNDLLASQVLNEVERAKNKVNNVPPVSSKISEVNKVVEPNILDKSNVSTKSNITTQQLVHLDLNIVDNKILEINYHNQRVTIDLQK